MAVAPDDVGTVWHDVAPMLEPALKHADDGTTMDEVRRHVEDMTSMLWLYVTDNGIEMSIVLSMENNELYAWLIGGHDMEKWLDELVGHMRRYALENGMTGLRAVTRPGLARTLRKRGWRTSAEIVRLPV